MLAAIACVVSDGKYTGLYSCSTGNKEKVHPTHTWDLFYILTPKNFWTFSPLHLMKMICMRNQQTLALLFLAARSTKHHDSCFYFLFFILFILFFKIRCTSSDESTDFIFNFRAFLFLCLIDRGAPWFFTGAYMRTYICVSNCWNIRGFFF